MKHWYTSTQVVDESKRWSIFCTCTCYCVTTDGKCVHCGKPKYDPITRGDSDATE